VYDDGAKVTFGNTGAGAVTIAAGGVTPGAVTVDNSSGHDYTFSGGPIKGSGGLTKVNTGTLTLASENTYSGPTQVNGGTLSLAGALPNSVVSVGENGTLTLRARAGQGVTLDPKATLNVYAGGEISGSLEAGEANLNFYLPVTLAAGDTLLSVSNNATITNSTVNVGIDGTGSPLKAGDSVTLLAAGGTLIGAPSNTATHGIGLYGVSLQYTFDLSTAGNKLLATVSSTGAGGGGGGGGDDNTGGDDGDNGGDDNTGGDGGGGGVTLNPRTKALSEGFLAGTTFLGQGTDFLTRQGVSAALKDGGRGKGFVVVGGGSLRHETGSHIEVDGYTLLAGAGVALGSVTLGGFFEHGQGDYSTYNSFANAASVRGSGDATYNGGGLLAHLKFSETAGGLFYGEASVRAGRIELDYKTRNLADSQGRLAAYKSESTYVGAHAGLGYLWKLNARTSLQAYGQYLWSQQGADSVRLTTGEPVKFKDVNSHRARVGATLRRDLSQSAKFHAGLAWEHEFDGKAKASIHGYRLDTPETTGSSGVLDVGLSFSPSPGSPLTLDINAQGYAGKRKGGTGGVRLNYNF
jgi:autotransporter-associated beta strand protein